VRVIPKNKKHRIYTKNTGAVLFYFYKKGKKCIFVASSVSRKPPPTPQRRRENFQMLSCRLGKPKTGNNRGSAGGNTCLNRGYNTHQPNICSFITGKGECCGVAHSKNKKVKT
jgi:hypothetical protein